MEFSYSSKHEAEVKRDKADPKSAAHVIETSETELQRNIAFHRKPFVANLLISDESLTPSTNDLGAMEMIALANSISDAK
jgi:hypothetical protein